MHRRSEGTGVGTGVEAGEPGELAGDGVVAEDQLLHLPLEPLQSAPTVRFGPPTRQGA